MGKLRRSTQYAIRSTQYAIRSTQYPSLPAQSPPNLDFPLENLMTKQTFSVPDMHCSNCAMRIESLEDELPGIKNIAASYRKGQVSVEFDEKLISADAIIAAVGKKGYTVATK